MILFISEKDSLSNHPASACYVTFRSLQGHKCLLIRDVDCLEPLYRRLLPSPVTQRGTPASRAGAPRPPCHPRLLPGGETACEDGVHDGGGCVTANSASTARPGRGGP